MHSLFANSFWVFGMKPNFGSNFAKGGEDMKPLLPTHFGFSV